MWLVLLWAACGGDRIEPVDTIDTPEVVDTVDTPAETDVADTPTVDTPVETDPPVDTDLPCAHPTEIVQASAPTGWYACGDGMFRRREVKTWPLPAYPCAGNGDECQTDGDCTGGSRCFQTGPAYVPHVGCACASTCQGDADCAEGEVCAPSVLLGPGYDLPRCVDAGDLIGGACPVAEVRVVPYQWGFPVEYPFEAACPTPLDTCDETSDCPALCRPVDGVWSCVSYPDGPSLDPEYFFTLVP